MFLIHMKQQKAMGMYLYELLVSFINLTQNVGGFFHKVFNRIHVVEGDKEDVLWPETQKHLIFKSHGHQVIELRKKQIERKPHCVIHQ